eukprot:COSAG02_NODE_2570_length_8510_cov_6.332541_7_plen_193_part_00
MAIGVPSRTNASSLIKKLRSYMCGAASTGGTSCCSIAVAPLAGAVSTGINNSSSASIYLRSGPGARSLAHAAEKTRRSGDLRLHSAQIVREISLRNCIGACMLNLGASAASRTCFLRMFDFEYVYSIKKSNIHRKQMRLAKGAALRRPPRRPGRRPATDGAVARSQAAHMPSDRCAAVFHLTNRQCSAASGA